MEVRPILAAFALASAALGAPPVTLKSLLGEMTDRGAISRWPAPAFTCGQFSSYDRESKTPSDAKGWFANNDRGQYLRVESVAGRNEWVMMDAEGPGAVVRVWSANPQGTLRFYLDGSKTPAIEAPMTDVLNGKWLVGEPLSGIRANGCNLYVPIPYAKSCKVTSDNGDFYYQVNYRTYEKGSTVETFTMDQLRAEAEAIKAANATLVGARTAQLTPNPHKSIAPGKSFEADFPEGPKAIIALRLNVRGPDMERALRSTVLSLKFDGEQTVWAPVGDFFGSGVGVNAYQNWYFTVDKNGDMTTRYVMPYGKNASIKLENLSDKPVEFALSFATARLPWDERSMHFHAGWRRQFPIHTRPFSDWNYVEIEGEGVYAGDSLSLVNPNEAWWGEGDEKIYVDGETFPSHFGTGTEDYYSYAWSSPTLFQAPFHAQTRCDGTPKSTWGNVTVDRVRLLDGIPFRKSLKMDMEVWHWKECDVEYAATTYWYARPGAKSNRNESREEAAKPPTVPTPLPPPMKIKGAIEAEKLKIIAKTEGLTAVAQGDHGPNVWSEDTHLWVQGKKVGDFVELRVPADGDGARKVIVYATRSWDYGIVRFSVNGKAAGEEVDLFNTKGRAVSTTGPIDLGRHEPKDGGFTLRVEVVGGNPKSEGSRSFFGVDCVVLEPVK